MSKIWLDGKIKRFFVVSINIILNTGPVFEPKIIEGKMLLRINTISVGIVLILGCLDEAMSGAWTRKQNSLYAKIGISMIGTNTFYTHTGNKIQTADFRAWSVDLYGEYGILDRLTGVVKFPAAKRARFETSEAKLGIGDLGLELKYGLLAGNIPIALGLGVELPTGDQNGFGLLKDQTNNPGGFIRQPTGDGELNTRATLYLSHSFYPVPAFISFEGGYNFRTKNFTDEYAFGLQAGYKLASKVWLQANLRGLGPVTDPDSELAGAAAIGLGEGVQYTSYGFGAAYEVDQHYSVIVDFFSAFGKITNIYSGVNFVVGISVEY